MSISDIFCSHYPWSGVLSSFFILYRWFYAWYILVNRVCHVIVYSFWGKSRTLLCTIVLVDPYGRYYVLPFISFLMINCYSLIIASFIAMAVFILRGGSTALWSSFLCHDVFDPGSFRFMFIELSSLVLRNKSHPSFLVGGCIGPFPQFKCTSCMVRTIS